MQLAEIYAHQYRWRRWPSVYSELGELSGRRVIDLGCAIGDQARDLARLGARVVGVDASREAIEHARSREIPNARFLCDDSTNLRSHSLSADGVWTSFLAAYFPRFERLLSALEGVLRSGGWLAITELDDLFGHEPLAPRWRAVIEKYYGRSLDEGLYHFRSRDHVRQTLSALGWRIEVDRDLDDDEFCFVGPAAPEVLEAWKLRLGFMMPRFLERFGNEAVGFDEAFLRCLQSEQHRSHARVWFLLARSPGEGQAVEERACLANH